MIATTNGRMPLQEAAKILGVHHRTLRRWRRNGLCQGRVKLPAVRVGDRVFVSLADLEAFQKAVDLARDPPPSRPSPDNRHRRSDRRREEEILAAGRKGR